MNEEVKDIIRRIIQRANERTESNQDKNITSITSAKDIPNSIITNKATPESPGPIIQKDTNHSPSLILNLNPNFSLIANDKTIAQILLILSELDTLLKSERQSTAQALACINHIDSKLNPLLNDWIEANKNSFQDFDDIEKEKGNEKSLQQTMPRRLFQLNAEDISALHDPIFVKNFEENLKKFKIEQNTYIGRLVLKQTNLRYQSDVWSKKIDDAKSKDKLIRIIYALENFFLQKAALKEFRTNTNHPNSTSEKSPPNIELQKEFTRGISEPHNNMHTASQTRDTLQDPTSPAVFQESNDLLPINTLKSNIESIQKKAADQQIILSSWEEELKSIHTDPKNTLYDFIWNTNNQIEIVLQKLKASSTQLDLNEMNEALVEGSKVIEIIIKEIEEKTPDFQSNLLVLKNNFVADTLNQSIKDTQFQIDLFNDQIIEKIIAQDITSDSAFELLQDSFNIQNQLTELQKSLKDQSGEKSLDQFNRLIKENEILSKSLQNATNTPKNTLMAMSKAIGQSPKEYLVSDLIPKLIMVSELEQKLIDSKKLWAQVSDTLPALFKKAGIPDIPGGFVSKEYVVNYIAQQRELLTNEIDNILNIEFYLNKEPIISKIKNNQPKEAFQEIERSLKNSDLRQKIESENERSIQNQGRSLIENIMYKSDKVIRGKEISSEERLKFKNQLIQLKERISKNETLKLKLLPTLDDVINNLPSQINVEKIKEIKGIIKSSTDIEQANVSVQDQILDSITNGTQTIAYLMFQKDLLNLSNRVEKIEMGESKMSNIDQRIVDILTTVKVLEANLKNLDIEKVKTVFMQSKESLLEILDTKISNLSTVTEAIAKALETKIGDLATTQKNFETNLLAIQKTFETSLVLAKQNFESKLDAKLKELAQGPFGPSIKQRILAELDIIKKQVGLKVLKPKLIKIQADISKWIDLIQKTGYLEEGTSLSLLPQKIDEILETIYTHDEKINDSLSDEDKNALITQYTPLLDTIKDGIQKETKDISIQEQILLSLGS